VRLPLYLVDAFADRAFAGNPAAICFLEFWLPEVTMQSIAAEMNLSETAFLVPTQEGWHIRWFTPTLEVDLVGHATLAAAFVIFERVARGVAEIRFTSLSGPLVVRRDGALLAMDLPARVPVPCAPPPGLVDGLGAVPVEMLAAQHYLAVFENEDAVRALSPRMDRLAALDRAAVIVTAPGRTSDSSDFVSRFFAPANGVPEDPVSGVAHCTLIPYWSRRLGKKRLIAHQVSRRGGTLVCEDRGDRVIVSGPAVLVLEGAFVLEAA
jgi:predicted PhzF superfamily epimerase YddE/YHI9